MTSGTGADETRCGGVKLGAEADEGVEAAGRAWDCVSGWFECGGAAEVEAAATSGVGRGRETR